MSLAIAPALLMLHGRIDADAVNVVAPHRAVARSSGSLARRIQPQIAMQSQDTISPDGDGLGDAVQLMACTHDASPLNFTAYSWRASRGFTTVWSTISIPRRDPLGPCASGYRAAASWDGSQLPSGSVGDGSYLIDACTGRPREFQGRVGLLEAVPTHQSASQVVRHTIRHDPASRAICTSQPVHVHVRRLDASIPLIQSTTPGSRVPVVIDTDRPHVVAELLQDDRPGAPVASWSLTPGSHLLHIPEHLQSGLYRLRIHGARGITRWIPLVIGAPTTPHHARTALVVWPLLTWRAYNHFDANGDGVSDSWYTRWSNRAVTLTGPFEHLGATPREGTENDAGKTNGFMQWLAQHPMLPARHITDVELARMPVEQLRTYRLIVFPGHTEYVEQRLLDTLNAFQRSGGNMIFLSANNLFRTVRMHPSTNTMQLMQKEPTRSARRDYSLTGVGFAKLERTRHAPYVLHPLGPSNRWIIAATSLRVGDTFGVATSEIDDIDATLSPHNAVVVAQASMERRVRASMVLVPGARGRGSSFSTGSMRFVRGMLMSRDARTREISSQLLLNVWKQFTAAEPMR